MACPEILIMAMAPAPEGVASATMASLFSILCVTAKVLKQRKEKGFKLIVCWVGGDRSYSRRSVCRQLEKGNTYLTK
jgi:hypothetical protein